MKKILILSLVMIFITGCSLKNLFIRENKVIDYLEGKVNVEINVKDYGVIKLELDADVAPITVTNFVNLVE